MTTSAYDIQGAAINCVFFVESGHKYRTKRPHFVPLLRFIINEMRYQSITLTNKNNSTLFAIDAME